MQTKEYKNIIIDGVIDCIKIYEENKLILAWEQIWYIKFEDLFSLLEALKK